MNRIFGVKPQDVLKSPEYMYVTYDDN